MKRWSSVKFKWNRKLVTLGAVAVLLMGAIAANFFLGGKAKTEAAAQPAAAQLSVQIRNVIHSVQVIHASSSFTRSGTAIPRP